MKFVKIQDVSEVNPRAKGVLLKPHDPVTFIPMAAVSEQSRSFVSAETRPYSEVSKGYTYFEEGDVIVAKITPCFENGKMALAEGLQYPIAFGSTEFHVLRPGKDLFNRYLFYLLQAPIVLSSGASQMKGAAGQKRVPADFFKNLEIPIPPLAEQKRIAAILDAADDLRTKRRESLAHLDSLLQSTFFEMFGDPVKNPKGWEMGRIGDLLSSTAYGTSKKAHESEGAFACLRMNNITYSGGWDFTSLKYVDLDPKEISKNTVHKGQLLFNRTNSRELVGKTAVYRREEPMAFAGYLVRGIPNSKGDAEYISAFLNLPQGKQTLQGMCKSIVGMANINAQEFKSIAIPMPPVILQGRFAEVVSAVEEQKSLVVDQLTELDTLFASLQSRAFRGEL